MIPSLVIFLHGVGSQGAHLAPLGQAWRSRMPGTLFEAPDGPEPFDLGGAGRQWFSVRGVTPENRAARIVAARASFDTVVGALVARHGLADHLDEVALVGFSQGSIMALDAVASGRWPVGAVVALAGRLASPPPFAPPSSTRIGLIHGDADPVMPVAEAFAARQMLSDAGYQVGLEVVTGGVHAITTREAGLACDFLADG